MTDEKGVVYYADDPSAKPYDRDLWRADHRARCPECTAFSTTMAYSGANTCETVGCKVDSFMAPAMPEAPHPNGDMHGHLEWVLAVQVGPRLRSGESIEQVRTRKEAY